MRRLHIGCFAAEPDRPWDLGRFVRTVAYFNEAPSPAKFVSSLFSQPLKALSAVTGNNVEARHPPPRLPPQTRLPTLADEVALQDHGGEACHYGRCCRLACFQNTSTCCRVQTLGKRQLMASKRKDVL